MMKTTLAGCFLAVAMLAGLLMTPFAIAQKQDQAEERMQGAHQRQPVEGGIQPAAKALLNPGQCNVPEFAFYVSFGYAKASLDIGQCSQRLGNAEAREAYERLVPDYADQFDQVAAARTRLAVPAQPAGRSNGSTMTALVSVADGSVSLLKMLPPTDSRNISRFTVFDEMPPWVWCLLHIRLCKL
jgi:hypothetical protein